MPDPTALRGAGPPERKTEIFEMTSPGSGSRGASAYDGAPKVANVVETTSLELTVTIN